MKRWMLMPAVLVAVALPAQARAGTFAGIVVAKQPQRGTVLVAGARGIGLTVRGVGAHALVGERITFLGLRLHDGTVRASRVQVSARARTATLRGIVIRRLVGGTLLASGGSMVTIHRSARRLASASDDGGLRPGEVAQFRVRFDDDGELIENAPPVQVGQATTVRIEGTIVSVVPFVVAAEGIPLTITVPAGATLPTGLAAGQRIELTAQVAAGNVVTLVAIEEDENAVPQEAQEVEVKGFVTGSTVSQLVVDANGTTVTFSAPTGTALPVLATGTFVEARGVRVGTTTTLERLRVEDDNGGDGDGGDGGGGH